MPDLDFKTNHCHVKCHIRQASIRPGKSADHSDDALAPGAEIWIETAQLPPGSWTCLVVYDCGTVEYPRLLSVTGITPSKPRITTYASRHALHANVRAIALTSEEFLWSWLRQAPRGKGGKDDDSTLLGDSNGRTPIIMPNDSP